MHCVQKLFEREKCTSIVVVVRSCKRAVVGGACKLVVVVAAFVAVVVVINVAVVVDTVCEEIEVVVSYHNLILGGRKVANLLHNNHIESLYIYF
jgi:hypothetical protein